MLPTVTHLFQPNAGEAPGETFHALLQTPHVRLERIVSRGQASPADFWYDQDTAEWVALLCGEAELEFEDGNLALEAGDALLIPAHCRHRVAACSDDALWLALHFADEAFK
ncbi:nif11 domain/cupin domain protein [compost metagenome]